MTRRVYESRQAAAAPGQEEKGKNHADPPPAPSRGVRVAGEVREREMVEVERIAGVLEVTTWIKRLSNFRR